MKSFFLNPFRFLFGTLCLVLSLLANNASATNVFWDMNGTTSGCGSATPNGSWESSFWSTSQNGTATTAAWVDGNFPEFAAGADGSGTYTVTANANHTISGMQLRTGTCTVAGTGTLTISSGLQNFNDTSAGTLTISNKLSGSGGVIAQSGTLNLSGNNNYSAGTQLNGGIVNINNNNSLGTGLVTFTAAGFSTLNAVGGTLITLPNNFSNSVAADGISFGGPSNTPVTCTGNWTNPVPLLLQNNGNSNAPLTLSGIISGAGGVALYATNRGKIIFSGANTYTGQTIIAGGTSPVSLSVSSLNSITGRSASSCLGAPTTVANGTISIGSNAITATLIYTGAGETSDRVINLNGTTGGATLQADGTGALNLISDFTATGNGAKTLTLQGTNTAANTIAGKIVNGVSSTVTSLIKTNSGSWTLSGTNTYTGSTTLNGGKLIVNGSIATSSGLTINSNATLMGGGTVPAVTINNGGIISPGANPGPGTLTTGAQTWAGGGNYVWEINDFGGTAGNNWDIINASSLNLTATPQTRFNIKVTSLTIGNIAGNAANFNNTNDYSIVLLHTTGGITGNGAGALFVDFTAFTNTLRSGGTFLVTNVGNDLVLTYRRAIPPVVSGQSGDQIIGIGGTAVFSASLSAGDNLAYIWKKDGVALTPANLVGLSSSNLTVLTATSADVGSYVLVVTNAIGGDATSPAILYFNSLLVALSDGFESYASVSGETNNALDKNIAGGLNRAANGLGNPWWGPAPPNIHVAPAENGVVPHGGTNMVRGRYNWPDYDTDYYNLSYRLNGGQNILGNVVFDWWFYDPNGSGDSDYLDFVALGNYNDNVSNTDFPVDVNGVAVGLSSSEQRLCLGASNPAGYDATKYQAHVYGTYTGLLNGWYNLPKTRSPGWHHARITLGAANGINTPVNFYIDDMITSLLAQNIAVAGGINTVEINSAFGETTGYFDDFSLQGASTLVQPSSQTGVFGSSAVFSVLAQSSTTINYQWQINGTNLDETAKIIGSTTSSLTIANLALTDAADYTCQVADSYGATNTIPAHLTVVGLLVSSLPFNTVVECGSYTNYTVTASGNPPISYQWLSNGIPVGGNSNSVAFSPATLSDSATYTVVVTNGVGTVSSVSGILTVIDAIPPVITVNGNNPVTTECHVIYVDPGVTASDICAGSLPVTTSGVLDTNTPGLYTLTYSATDGAFASTATRLVQVHSPGPVVTVTGSNPYRLVVHTNFTDPGATASDVCSGNNNLTVTTSGTVNQDTVGYYTLTYSADDGNGVTNSATRLVSVQELQPPTLSIVSLRTNVAVNWTGGIYTLQAALDVPIVWEDVFTGVGPYIPPQATNYQTYYRLKN